MKAPSFRHNELQRSLTRLHAELSATSQISEGSRKLLREVLSDIEHLLERTPADAAHSDAAHSDAARPAKPAHPASDAERPGSLAPHRLEALAVEFENQHPRLSATLWELIDLLGRAGI